MGLALQAFVLQTGNAQCSSYSANCGTCADSPASCGYCEQSQTCQSRASMSCSPECVKTAPGWGNRCDYSRSTSKTNCYACADYRFGARSRLVDCRQRQIGQLGRLVRTGSGVLPDQHVWRDVVRQHPVREQARVLEDCGWLWRFASHFQLAPLRFACHSAAISHQPSAMAAVPLTKPLASPAPTMDMVSTRACVSDAFSLHVGD